MSKSILFLSIMDFTDKGIQVVKFTPEYFVKNGWDVDYLVTRDNSIHGSYFYQDIINPKGMDIHRMEMFQLRIAENLYNHTLKTIYSKIRGYISIIQLAWYGYKIVKSKEIDILYGGGPHGVLAAHLINMCIKNKKYVISRYYGIWNLYNDFLVNKKKIKLLLNWDILLSLWLKSSKVIITNDGTEGNKALKKIRTYNMKRLSFFVNGTNYIKSTNKNMMSAYTVCRLVQGKRIDRIINIVNYIVHVLGVSNFIYNIIGDGQELKNLKKMVDKLNLNNNIIFHGAKINMALENITKDSAIFFSTYDVSNVANPLLEAIRAHKIIFTLNNGDTSSWIKHKINGFIYDIEDSLYETIARDVVDLFENQNLQNQIFRNIESTEKEKLWTWDERLESEYQEIYKLVH
ncbi:MAG: hypothetical protein COB42_04155 [Sulfurimonas sp.]|nr:MAG: hypothetical protein COB42_04155 [Sulfurimonas sp.]